MKRSSQLTSNPDQVRAWQERSRRRMVTRAPLRCRTAMKRGGRLKAKPDPKMTAWTKAVKERDGNECQAQKFSGMSAYEFTGLLCGGPIDAHHIAERSLRPDLKYDVANGIALCRTHHRWLPLNRAEAIRIGLLSDKTYEAAMKESNGL
jgi:hypothetical protein